MDQRDLSIIAQNAGSTAAAMTGQFFRDTGESFEEYLARYEQAREHVFQGTLSRAGGSARPPVAASTEQAAAKVEAAFGGAEDVTDSPSFRIIEKGSTGQPAPDWLAREVAYQIKQGKVAHDDTDLFDNRGSLPQFGGTGNANAPWFRTAKGKVGLWPPRPKGGK